MTFDIPYSNATRRPCLDAKRIMSYLSVAWAAIGQARASGIARIASLDLETKVLGGDDGFLTGETVLAASLAWREEGRIRTETFILAQETQNDEWKLFGELDSLLHNLKPLVLVGYCINRYDVPLLHLKMRNTPRPFWGIEDTICRAFILDLKDPVRFAISQYDGSPPRMVPFGTVLRHDRFSQLALMRVKGLVEEGDKRTKGEAIYQLWKNNREAFATYSEGDAHDALMIFEELFPAPHANTMEVISQ
jgi:DNA polymerase elongation subunit (family B)